MRKLFFVLVFALMTVANINAQNMVMTFKDVAMNTTTAEMAQRLVDEKGLTLISAEAGKYFLEGVFQGEESYINLNPTSPSDQQLLFIEIYMKREFSTWTDLDSTYKRYKNALVGFYGQPLECMEDYNALASKKSDKAKFNYLATSDDPFGAFWMCKKEDQTYGCTFLFLTTYEGQPTILRIIGTAEYGLQF